MYICAVFDPKPMEEEAKDKVKIRMGFLGLKNLTAGKGGGTAVEYSELSKIVSHHLGSRNLSPS